MGRKKRSLPDDEYELTGQLRHIFRKPQPSKELSKPVNFIVKCGNLKWHVHEEPIVQQSGFFKMMSDSKFREATEHTVNLPEDEPELVARMIMYCYFREYPLSPNSELRFGVPTVTQVMEDNMIEESGEFIAPNEHIFDAVLHLKMYVLADKFDMRLLGGYARKRIVAVLKYEPEGLWPCLEMLQDLPDYLVQDVEKKLARFLEYGRPTSWVTIGTIERLEELSPGLAAELSDNTKDVRFGRDLYFNRPGELVTELPKRPIMVT